MIRVPVAEDMRMLRDTAPRGRRFGGRDVPVVRETVRNYLAAAVTKLGARNRVDAARIAEEAGWL